MNAQRERTIIKGFAIYFMALERGAPEVRLRFWQVLSWELDNQCFLLSSMWGSGTVVAQIGRVESRLAFGAGQAKLFLCGRLSKLDAVVCSHLVSHRHHTATTTKLAFWPKFASSLLAPGFGYSGSLCAGISPLLLALRHSSPAL